MISVYIVLFSLVLPVRLSAQKFDRISLEQGLSHGAVYSIVQDTRGFIWFGTEEGLDRYDGYAITVIRHDPANPASLSSNDIGKILVEPSGIMWIGTWGNGLNRYDPKTYTFDHFQYNPDDPGSLSGNRIELIFRDSAGRLWIGTEKSGLNRYDEAGKRFIRYHHDAGDPAGLSSDWIKTMCEDDEGRLWVGTNEGLNRMDGDSGPFVHYQSSTGDPTGLNSNLIRSIIRDKNGILWIGTRGGGLNRFDPDTDIFKAYKHDPGNPNSLSDDSITQVYEDTDGILWIGTYYGGLNRFDPETETFRRFTYDPQDPCSLSHNRVEVLFEDRGKVLWIGTRGGGVNKLDLKPAKFKNYTYNPHQPGGLPHSSVYAAAGGEDGQTAWIGTDGGLRRFDPLNDRFSEFQPAPNTFTPLSGERIRSIITDRNRNLWVGTYNEGIYRMVPTTAGGYRTVRYKHNASDPTSIGSDHINVIYEDKDGDIWIGTKDGLNRYVYSPSSSNSRFQRFTAEDGKPGTLSGSYVSAIYQDHRGILWIASDNGLNRLEKHREIFILYKHIPTDPHSLSCDNVQVIYEAAEDTFNTVLWIGTEVGLNKFDMSTQRFKRYMENDGLPANHISGILSDYRGYLWLSTGKGLSLFDPETETFKNYDIGDSLNHGFNRNACYKDLTGRMYFGGAAGLTVFSPDEVMDNPYVPPVVLTSFKVFNEEVDFGRPIFEINEVTLSYRQNFISLEFAALDYTNPTKNRYAYRMNGIDADWISSDSRRFAGYPNLSPGKYEFHVKGANNDGAWNQEGIIIKINIEPPFWLTWWFRILVLLALGSSVFITFRVRIHQVEKRNKELREANLKLEEEIRKREQVEAERASLQEQLRHAQKLETIGTLAGGIAHDFNNILGPILGYTQMSLEETTPDSVIRGWLENVQKAAYRAKELVQQILVFGRRDSQEYKPVKIQLIAREALRLVRASLPTTIEIQQDICGDCPAVLADPTQVHQVVINLCTNAKHAMQEYGGILTLSLKTVTVNAEMAGIHANLRIGKYVCLTVSDTGHGMDRMTMERMFEPFFTTRKPGEGTGLGLSVVHGIVMGHDGEITASSKVGEGTEFSVYLPAVESDLETAEEMVKTGAVPKGTEHILLVDDEESMIVMGRVMLEQLGYRVTTFTDSAKALHLFREEPRLFDLVLTDQTMPQFTGTVLSREMKAIRPGLPVIVMSGFSESIDTDNIGKYNIEAYLPKPFNTYTLGTLVREVLDRKPGGLF